MTKRTNIKASRYPLSTKGYGEIEEWLKTEQHHIQSGHPSPNPKPLLQGWPHDPKKLTSDSVGLLIRYEDGSDSELRGQTARIFDPAIVAFMRIALAFRGSMGLDAVRESNEEDGQYYPKIQLGAAPTSTNMKVARVVLDTPPRKHARMVKGGSIYDFRARNLYKGNKTRMEHRDGEWGREAAITASLLGFDDHHKEKTPLVSRDCFERLLRRALQLATEREKLRCSKAPEADVS